jgi:hypothetical protein
MKLVLPYILKKNWPKEAGTFLEIIASLKVLERCIPFIRWIFGLTTFSRSYLICSCVRKVTGHIDKYKNSARACVYEY